MLSSIENRSREDAANIALTTAAKAAGAVLATILLLCLSRIEEKRRTGRRQDKRTCHMFALYVTFLLSL